MDISVFFLVGMCCIIIGVKFLIVIVVRVLSFDVIVLSIKKIIKNRKKDVFIEYICIYV